MLKKSGATYDFDLSKAMFKNKLYTVDSDAGTFDEANSSVMYYPLSGDPVKFVAYYPYSISADDVDTPNTLTFNFTEQDEADGSEKEAKDFIFHKDEEEVEYNGSTSVSLKFKHQFSKILITIINESGEEFTADNLQVRLNGMPQTATVDLTKLAKGQDGALALTGTTDIKPHIRPIEFDHAYIEAIVPPHLASAYTTREFKFTVGTKEYKYPVTNDFVSGNSYAYVLTLAQGHIANCYIVNPGTAENPTTSEAIPIVRASKYGGMLAGAEVHLEVLWDDNGVINNTTAPPTLNGSSFTVTTTGNHGNAGIALRDNTTNNIYWSWHIWVTDYDPSIPENTWTNPNSPTYTFMDRNLGATAATYSFASYGFLYQFGRKDPFPGVFSGTAGYSELNKFSGISVRSPIAVSYINSIQNPNTYIDGYDGGLYSWSTLEKTKTENDPCPYGWKVPVWLDGPYSDAATQNNPWLGITRESYNSVHPGGFTCAGSTWQLGCRRGPAGDAQTGRFGYWWSGSKLNGGNATWCIYNGSIGFDGGGEGFGFSVRCVQED
jgi:hypothetical protein